ncbi:hypothetical protein Baya_2388 [Bagarius yarrelli]|uniref:Uncharacterized protein n=1 Tax=Bagarius yarrelli TaxID=175774 RepID=A0A556TNT8_BAGYA|nr:hypothetical protein Baya_2388 [Bagarius yarrelli]
MLCKYRPLFAARWHTITTTHRIHRTPESQTNCTVTVRRLRFSCQQEQKGISPCQLEGISPSRLKQQMSSMWRNARACESKSERKKEREEVIKVGSPRGPDLCCPEQARPPLSAFRKIRAGHQQACAPVPVPVVPCCTKKQR